MDNIAKIGIIASIIVVAIVIIFAAAMTAQQTDNTYTQEQVADDPCSRLDYEIEQNLRPVYDQKLVEYNDELREYNKEWLPAPSFTNQMEQMREELIRLQTQLDTLVDQYNQECAS